MEDAYEIKQQFQGRDFKLAPLVKGEYDQCHFVNCTMGGSDLSGIRFSSCSFTGCDLSLARLEGAWFYQAYFKDCKMLGLPFYACTGVGLSFGFEGCNLSHSSFYQMNLQHTRFKDTLLQEVDFTGCDLSGSVWDQCDCAGARFERSILVKADMRRAFHYSIDPELNRIRHARFALEGVAGLLDKYDIEIETF